MDFVSCRDAKSGEQVLLSLRYIVKIKRKSEGERADAIMDCYDDVYECVTEDGTFGSLENCLVSITAKEMELAPSWENIPIEKAKLSLRAENTLKRRGCVTIADMMSVTENELIRVRGVGQKTVEEILNTQDMIRKGSLI